MCTYSRGLRPSENSLHSCVTWLYRVIATGSPGTLDELIILKGTGTKKKKKDQETKEQDTKETSFTHYFTLICVPWFSSQKLGLNQVRARLELTWDLLNV